ncbi:MAG: 1-acyl-sn-glycerol-3-phosphate acyltransferase [Treponema sp.]|jgi:1-acyl-sn-glycerol-3-phosphate acyltransferase|nr:1-acyl-sn-glycerol-3-phosphate acyltransferase [Treponema sp.]
MPYKHGQALIDNSLPFRLASALTFYPVFSIAHIVNIIQYSTSYENRDKLLRHRRAILICNHTTFLDPVKMGGAVWPRRVYQTMLEATVEFPVLGTFIRLLGGVPIPRGGNSLAMLQAAASTAFRFRRYLLFYPEGECYLYNQKIRKFRPGAFYLSAHLDIPVIPMVTVFSGGKYKPYSFFGRAFPREKLVVLDPVYPSGHIKREANGEISTDSIRDYAQAVRSLMQAEIDRRGGCSAFYRGRMDRIRGLNDK